MSGPKRLKDSPGRSEPWCAAERFCPDHFCLARWLRPARRRSAELPAGGKHLTMHVSVAGDTLLGGLQVPFGFAQGKQPAPGGAAAARP